MVFGARCTGVPSSRVMTAASLVSVATSPSSSSTTLRVWASSAGMSLAQSISPSPMPMTRGLSDFGERGTHGVCQALGPGTQRQVDEVGDDLGVRVAGEADPLALQVAPQHD